MTIKVLIVDDHSVVLQGLKNLLSLYKELEIVGAASSGEEALQLAYQLQPQVVLLDLLMPKMDGFEVTTRLKQMQPDIKILILTSVQEKKLVARALSLGASGYLLKNMESAQIEKAIRASLADQLTLSPEVAELMHTKPTVRNNFYSPEILTNREKEILTQLVQGKANKEIAYTLSVSEGTVKSHLSSIMSKLGAQSRTQLAIYASQNNLV